MPSASDHREFVCTPDARIGLRADFHTDVEAFDIRDGTRISLTKTIFSWGGRRLAISDDGRHFIAGGWANKLGGGVACYEVETGRIVWHERRLARSHHLRYDPVSDGWLASLARGGTHVLDRLDGQTRLRMPGAILTADATSRRYFIERKRWIDVVSASDGARQFRVRPPRLFAWRHPSDFPPGFPSATKVSTSPPPGRDPEDYRYFGVKHESLTAQHLLVSVVCGPLLCYSAANFTFLWQLEPDLGAQFLRVGASPRMDIGWAVHWSFSHGRPTELWTFSLDSGTLLNRTVVREEKGAFHWDDAVFCADQLLCGDVRIDLRTMERVALT
jgi:hypothetical protein